MTMQRECARPSPDFQYWLAKDRGPTAREQRILRRIEESGGLVLTHRGGGTSFAFGDGVPVKAEFGFDHRLFEKFEALHWIVPDPCLLRLFGDGPAQVYFAGSWR